jgi:hypothetical protein
VSTRVRSTPVWLLKQSVPLRIVGDATGPPAIVSGWPDDVIGVTRRGRLREIGPDIPDEPCLESKVTTSEPISASDEVL